MKDVALSQSNPPKLVDRDGNPVQASAIAGSVGLGDLDEIAAGVNTELDLATPGQVGVDVALTESFTYDDDDAVGYIEFVSESDLVWIMPRIKLFKDGDTDPRFEIATLAGLAQFGFGPGTSPVDTSMVRPLAGLLSTAAMQFTSAARATGYQAGAGGTVTQASTKSTGVTLNRPSGRITMVGSALAAATAVTFTLTNSCIGADDVLILSHKATGTLGNYAFNHRCAAGSAQISVHNRTAGSLSNALQIQFAIIKGAVA